MPCMHTPPSPESVLPPNSPIANQPAMPTSQPLSTAPSRPLAPLPRHPIEVLATGTSSNAEAASVKTAVVRVLVVTWNRKAYAANILRSLSKQTYPRDLMDVTVIDNASTDGTLDDLRDQFAPECIVSNHTEAAHQPNFQRDACSQSHAPNSLGFRSLTIIRNHANMGGCGGFNTGFGFTEWLAEQAGDKKTAAPDYLWLVDDDADVPPDALEQLTSAMESSGDIGLVGSRTVNIADRRTTIETTIYYNFWTGGMQDDCPPENPKRQRWLDWVGTVGGTRGERPFKGLIDVDVVSACSMLARWKAVVGTPEKAGVGFWDHRYFIYCDDADWCLRFAKAGWRVVLNLDAVVFHTPWNLKLTPARIYYANRNKVWMGQKVLEGEQLRTVTRGAMKSMVMDSLNAAFHRRLFHANIILDTATHIASNTGGKTGSDGPPGEGAFEAFRRLKLLRKGRRVAVLIGQGDAPKWAESLREYLGAEIARLPEHERKGLAVPEFVHVRRNDLAPTQADSVVYGSHWKSKLKKQLHLWSRRPRAVVVFESTNDFPVLLRGGWNLHIDQKKPTTVQVERDGWLPRLAFLTRWVPAAIRCRKFARTIEPHTRTSKYG